MTYSDQEGEAQMTTRMFFRPLDMSSNSIGCDNRGAVRYAAVSQAARAQEAGYKVLFISHVKAPETPPVTHLAHDLMMLQVYVEKLRRLLTIENLLIVLIVFGSLLVLR